MSLDRAHRQKLAKKKVSNLYIKTVTVRELDYVEQIPTSNIWEVLHLCLELIL